MNLLGICILFSSISFFFYSIYYFVSPLMKDELRRLGMPNLGRVIVVCQFLGASGLLLGFIYQPLLNASSLGLALMMLCGLAVRMRSKDSLWVSLPALFYMVLNAYIFFYSIV